MNNFYCKADGLASLPTLVIFIQLLNTKTSNLSMWIKINKCTKFVNYLKNVSVYI